LQILVPVTFLTTISFISTVTRSSPSKTRKLAISRAPRPVFTGAQSGFFTDFLYQLASMRQIICSDNSFKTLRMRSAKLSTSDPRTLISPSSRWTNTGPRRDN
uniref:Secreted protein n=1 Tax=Romanomermis culicivorax TaxID=13658 RepID=A0A915I0E9_ROMCU